MNFNAFQDHSRIVQNANCTFKSSDESIYQHQPCCILFFLSLHSLYFIPKPNVTQRKIINYALKHTMANVLKSFLTLTPFWLLKSVLRHWMAIFICEKNGKEKENYSLINNNNEILSLMPFDMVANQINNTQSTCSFHQTEALFCNRGEH